MTLEDQLKDALHARAEQFEPSEDAFLQMKRRMAADLRSGHVDRDRGGLGPRLLAVAASLAVLVGAGAFVMQQRSDGESVNVDGAVTTSGPTGQTDDQASGAEGDGSGDPSAASAIGPADQADSPTQADSGIDVASLEPAPSGVFGPRRTTWQAASLDFLELIQFESERATLEPAGNRVEVTARGENGSMLPVSSLEIGTTTLLDGSPGFVVVAATSPKVSIVSPAPRSTITNSVVTVTGTGTGFEANVGVRLYSADDGVWLNAAGAQAGNFGELLPFEKQLAVAGRENAWIVVISSTGSDAGIPEFAAEAVTINAPMPAATVTVSGIPLNDPDGGLVVRDMPGSAVGDKLFVLSAGFDQVRVRGLSANIDGQRWLNVWLPPAEAAAFDRKAGWVHSAYLTAGTPIDNATLNGIADEFIGAYKAGAVGFDQLPWSDRLIHVGWTGGLKVFGADELRSFDAWSADRDWLIPAERFGDSVTTAPLIDFVDSLGDAPVASEFNYPSAKSFGTDPSKVSPYGGDQAELVSRFAGTSWVQFTDPGSDGSEWQTTTLFVESTDDGPGIVGVVVTFWIP